MYLRLGKAYEKRMKGASDKSQWLNLALSCYAQALQNEETRIRALEDSAMLELASLQQGFGGAGAIRRALVNLRELRDDHGDDDAVNVEDVSQKIKVLEGMLDRDPDSD